MVEILRALPTDAVAILELQRLAYQSEVQLYPDVVIPPLLQTVEELQGDFTAKVFLKAEEAGAIIGSVRGFQTGNTCYVERLIVHPDCQGRGIGTTLMEKFEQYFDEAERLELFTGEKSVRNIRLYERLGYRIFRREAVNSTLVFVFMEKCRKT